MKITRDEEFFFLETSRVSLFLHQKLSAIPLASIISQEENTTFRSMENLRADFPIVSLFISVCDVNKTETSWFTIRFVIFRKAAASDSFYVLIKSDFWDRIPCCRVRFINPPQLFQTNY